MPRTYRHSIPLPDDASSEVDSVDEYNDPDDNIFLSDLVRTGEASRLRRRGAMRLDHTAHHGQLHRPPSPTVIVVDTGSGWEEGSSGTMDHDREPLGTGAVHRRRTGRERLVRREPKSLEDEYDFSLFCGGSEELVIGDETPFTPSVLPTFPFVPGHDQMGRGERHPRRTNGCGALLHIHGSPKRDLGVWQVKGSATDAVISMDAQYFDRPAIAKVTRSSCGCIREGVGCAVCGNPLGTRYRPCKTAGSSIFCSSPKPSGPPAPEGPRYWRASLSTSPSSSHPPYIYTFLSTAVSSNPDYTFPLRPKRSSRSHTQSTDSQPASLTEEPRVLQDQPIEDNEIPNEREGATILDRLLTASPQPLSEPEVEDAPREDQDAREAFFGRQAFWRDALVTYRLPIDDDGNEQPPVVSNQSSRQSTIRPDQYAAMAEFDPDGEFLDMDLVPEPGSPDKVFQPTLFP